MQEATAPKGIPEPPRPAVAAVPEPPRRCPSCEHPISDRYCAHCGQNNADLHVSVGHLLRDFLHEYFDVDSKLVKTIGWLLVKPGFLTHEYLAGKRSRYVGPFRLYLVASLLFFFAFALLGGKNMVVRTTEDSAPAPAVAGEAEPEKTEPTPAASDDAAPADKESFGAQFDSHVRKFAADPNTAGERLALGISSYVPKAMFVLLPFFALLLKGLYRRSGRVYAEHFIFALHYHAFAFIGMLANMLAPWPSLKALLALGVAAQLYFALKTAYAQSWGKTLLKGSVLLFSYSIVLLVAMAAITIAVIWTSAPA